MITILNNILNETKIGTATVIVDILDKGKVIPNVKINPTAICIHQTGNVGATAKNNHNYMKNCNKSGERIATLHNTVDDKFIIQAAPTNMKCFHAGSTVGNNTSIGIEICMFDDAKRQKKAYDNAIALVKVLMGYHGFKLQQVKRHKDFSGKYCPAWLLDNKFGYSWSWFLGEIGGEGAAKEPASFKIKVINCDKLNARIGPGTNYAVKESVKVNTILTIVGESGNWYRTKSGLYVSKSYCKKI